MPESEVRLVCFDWGGVILRICRSLPEGCAAAGLPVRDAADSEALRARRRELTAMYQTGRIPCERYFSGVAEATGGAYTPEEIQRIHDAWLIEEYPGVDGVLADLAEAPKIETGLLSNTNARHWARHLPGSDGRGPDFPAIGMLQHRHASHLLGHAKPTENIYESFERQTGCPGRAILFFDDLEENINAARRRGWQAVQIDHAADTASQIRAHLERAGVL